MSGIRLSFRLLVVCFLVLGAGIIAHELTRPVAYQSALPRLEASVYTSTAGILTSPYDGGEFLISNEATDTGGGGDIPGAVLGASTSYTPSFAPQLPRVEQVQPYMGKQTIAVGPGLTIKKGKVRCRSASDETFGCISPGDFENFSEKLDEDALEDSESLADLIGDGTGSGALVFGEGATMSALTVSGLTLSDVSTSSLLATNAAGSVVGTTSIAVQALSVLGSATSTFQHGINLATGCFAVSGVCVTGGGGGGGITDLNGLIASTQTFATSSDINIRVAVTSTGSVHTFTPSWSGVLAIARGGTGTSTAPTTGQLLMGNGSGGYDLVATSSLGLSAGVVAGTMGQIPYYALDGSLLTATSSLFIGTSGNIGIGSTSPWAKLSVTNTSNSQPSFVVEDANSPDQTPFIIDAQGRVGIGSTSPSAELVISSTNPSFLVDDTSGGGSQLEFVVSGSNTYMRSGESVDDATARFRLVRTGTTNTNVAFFDIYASTTYLNGKLAIGTTTPQSDFHVHNATGDSIITVTGSNSANRGLNFNLLAGTPVWSFLMDSSEDLVLQEQRSGLNMFRMKNTAGADLFLVDSASGNFAIGTSTLGGMLRISDATSTTGALFVSSSQATPGSGVNLATFQTYDANWDRPLLRVIDNSTSGAAANLRLDSPNPDIEFVETDQTAPSGKFEIAVNGNRFQVNSRRLDETAFETILEFAQHSQTSVDALTLNIDSISATRNALKIINASSSAGAQPGIAWRNEPGLVDTARISSASGASNVNSKLFFEVANSSKALQTRMVIDVAGNVGIGTTSPYRLLSVTGASHLGGDVLATGTLTVLGNTSLQGASTTALSVSGAVFDGAGSPGTVGYVLQTTGTGVAWVATSSLGLGAGGGSGTVNSGTSGQLAYYASNGTAVSGSSLLTISGNNFGIGTTTPNWTLQVASATPYIGITDTNAPINAKQWLLGNVDGVFTIGTSTDTLSATSSLFSITNASTTFARALSVSSTGTSTFAGGLNITGGCYASNGTCLSASQWTTAGSNIYYTTGNVGVGSSSPSAALTVQNTGSNHSFVIEDTAADTSPFLVDASGNVSIGTTSSNYKLTVSGDILIANNTNTGTTSATTTWTQILEGGNTVSSQSIGGRQYESIFSMAVYNGSLYMGLSSTTAGGAALARYDGSTTTIIWQATSTYESVKVVWVHDDGLLYFGLGDSTNGEADILTYNSSNGATTSVGQLGTVPDYVDSFATFQGELYACGSGATADDTIIYRYDGGTTWTVVFADTSLNLMDGCDLAVYDGSLYMVTNSSAAGRYVLVTSEGTIWDEPHFAVGNPDRPQYSGEDFVVFEDSLLLLGELENGTPGVASIVPYSSSTYAVNTGGTEFRTGHVFNGNLYLGSSDIYKYKGGKVGEFTGYNRAHAMAEYNGKLYVGFGDGVADADLYAINLYPEGQNSYGLNFTSTQAGMTSLGTLWFEAGDMFSGYYDDTTGIANAGTFKLSHTLVTAAGAYDVAEDYPTNEDDLMAGDILAFDEHEKGYVRKATPGDDARLAGVVSGRPGFLLSAKDRSGMVPMALAGRVEVQVGPENGPVHVGDSITLSSTTPGVGVRASFGDSAIGYALEPLSESVATTTILVYVTHNQSLQMGVDLETLSGTIELHGSTVMERLIALASNFVDGVLRVAGIRTNELCIGATCVNEAQLIEILNKTNTHTDVDEYEEVETPQGDEEVIETPPDTTGATTSPDIPPQEEIPEPETITSDEVVSGILPGSDTEPLPTTEQTNITPTE